MGILGFQVGGFSSGGGGVQLSPPKLGGGGGQGWEKGSIDRYHKSIILNTGAKGAEKIFEH